MVLKGLITEEEDGGGGGGALSHNWNKKKYTFWNASQKTTLTEVFSLSIHTECVQDTISLDWFQAMNIINRSFNQFKATRRVGGGRGAAGLVSGILLYTISRDSLIHVVYR